MNQYYWKNKREENNNENEAIEENKKIEDFLEGMKDPFDKDWTELEQEWKLKSVYIIIQLFHTT